MSGKTLRKAAYPEGGEATRVGGEDRDVGLHIYQVIRHQNQKRPSSLGFSAKGSQNQKKNW